jgi:hypothetical protein
LDIRISPIAVESDRNFIPSNPFMIFERWRELKTAIPEHRVCQMAQSKREWIDLFESHDQQDKREMAQTA